MADKKKPEKQPVEKKFPATKTDKTEMNLPCELTQEELVKRGEHLSKLIGEQTVIEDEKKSSADIFKNRLARVGLNIRETSYVIGSKRETRLVKCVKTWDYKRGVVEIHRNDTGELVSTHAMTSDERQGNLFDLRDRVGALEEAKEEAKEVAREAVKEAVSKLREAGVTSVKAAD